MKPWTELEEGLNELAVIRATFETMGLFPAEDSVCGEMREIIDDARHNLVRRLQALRDKIQADPGAFPFDYARFQKYTLEMMQDGYPGRSLNRFMKVKAFDEGESSLFYFEIAGLVEIEEARRMPAPQFFLMLLNEILQCVQAETSYASGQIFDGAVFPKYIALMFLYYAVTDPLFYNLRAGQD